MSSSSDNPRARALARRHLHQTLLERFGAPEVDIAMCGATATVYTLAPKGDMALCLRLNNVDAAKVAATLECLEGMLAYCASETLAPTTLVVGEIRGRVGHDERVDLDLIESMVVGGRVSDVLWRSATDVSRSVARAWRHFAILEDADAELHLLEPRGPSRS